MTQNPILFLNVAAASAETLFDYTLDEGYRYLCTFFTCGLIDRTHTLKSGLVTQPHSPMPLPFEGTCPSLQNLASKRAQTLLEEAENTNKDILILWSGGIDSSTALAYLIAEAQKQNLLHRLTVGYTWGSRLEHPAMFKRLKKLKINRKRKRHIAAMTKNWGGLIVTGEGGDQLFGSAKALGYSLDILTKPWPSGLAHMLQEELDHDGAEKALQAVTPVLNQHIGKDASTFKALWWLNISCKWNTVMYRMATMDTNPFHNAQPRYRHFFADTNFQRWALTQDRNTPPSAWTHYKMEMRQALLACDGDKKYFDTKLKEPSLCKAVRPTQNRVVVTTTGLVTLLPEIQSSDGGDGGFIEWQLGADSTSFSSDSDGG